MKKGIFGSVVVVAFSVLLCAGNAHAFVPENSQAGGARSELAVSRKNRTEAVLAGRTQDKSRIGKEYKDGELLVKFKTGTSENQKLGSHGKHHAKRLKRFKRLELEHVKLSSGVRVEDAIAQYKKDPDVEYAEPNYIVTAQGTPNDTYFSNLWGMYNTGQTGGTPNADISATRAWDISTGNGDGSVVVAVIDTGIDYTHEDLAGNIWVNSGELAGNGVDDDANGYIDDLHGINAITGSGDPLDDNGHGTHVAGTIGAMGNNTLGVVGVNWNVKILGCKFLDSSGSGAISDAVTCLEYIRDLKTRGVNIVASNNSWGGGGYSQAMYDAISAQMASGILFIAAAGNWSYDNDSGYIYPAGYALALPNVIAAAATDHNDAMASFSDYGRHSVAVGAPGVDIVSLRAAGTDIYGDGQHLIPSGDPSAKYYKASGTSMASPHVAGLAALIKSADTSRDWRTIRSLIISSGDDLASLKDITITGKRINAYSALTCNDKQVFSVLSSPTSFTIGVPVTMSVLSIDCGSPAGPVTATMSSGEVIQLLDDGVGEDRAAGDGIFTATWTPTGTVYSVTLSSPTGQAKLPPLNITTNYLLEGNTRTDYSQSLGVVGGTPPFSWSISSGSLPPGLTLDSSTGVISGRPTVTGNYTFFVRADDSDSGMGTKSFSLPVSDHFIIEERALIAEGVSLGVTIDAAGNRYVVGQTDNEIGGTDYLTTKYDLSGNVVWQKKYRGSAAYNVASGVAVGGDGSVYVTGDCFNGMSFDLSIVKYDPSGELLWVRSIARGGYRPAMTGVAIDGQGNVLVTGTDNSRATMPEQFLVAKYSPSGSEVWQRFYDNGGAGAHAQRIAVDRQGNAYVTGYTFSQGGAYPPGDIVLTVKFDPSGNVAWSRPFCSNWLEQGTAYDYGRDVAVDVDGNIYVAAHCNCWILILKYDANGNLVGSQWYIEGLYTDSWGIAIDRSGNVYISGYTIYTPTGPAETLLIKYGPQLNKMWSKVTPRGGGQSPNAVAVDGAGNIVTAGGFSTDAVTLFYRDTSLHVTSTAVGHGRVNVPYSQTLTASGGTMPYTWSLGSGSLPPGLTLSSTGVISGIPTQVGTFSYAAALTDNAAGEVVVWGSITIYQPVSITTSSLPFGRQSVAYNATLTAEGGIPPYRWSITSGALPDGLTLDADTGAVSGIPVEAGTFNVMVRAGDVNDESAEKALSLLVSSDVTPPVTTAYPPGGSYIAGQTVSLRTSEPATIYCTTDGSDPVVPTNICNGSIPVNHSMTLKYFAVDPYGNTETANTASYTIAGGQVSAWGVIIDVMNSSPVQVNGLEGVVSVAAGYSHMAALKSDGTVWSWGQNYYGQYGDGSRRGRAAPVQAIGLTDVVAITSVGNGTMALKRDGTLWTWGNYQLVPVQYADITGVISVAQGYAGQTLAVKSDGTVWTWDSNVPGFVQVNGLSNVAFVAAGNSSSYAVKNDGTLWVWSGQTGVPALVTGLTDVVAVAGGLYHTIALTNDGKVWTWGSNQVGQLGDGSTNPRSAPGWVSSIGRAVAVAANQMHSLAVTSDGKVWAWGSNGSGQLGDGTQTDRHSPVQVLGITSGSGIGAGWWSSAAITQGPLSIDASTMRNGTISISYSDHIAVSGGVPPYSYAVLSGSLPAGLTLDASTGIISGIPSALGGFSFDVQVTDSTSAIAAKQVSLTIYDLPTITTVELPSGEFDTPYSQGLTAAGGPTPYIWSITAGALPSGLVLNSASGEIAGVPLAVGTYGFTAKVRDSNDMTVEKQLSITINTDSTPLAITTTALASGEAGKSYSQVLNAAGGLTPYTWSIAVGALPSGLALDSGSGEIAGTPLTAGTCAFTTKVTDAYGITAESALSIVIDPDTTPPVTHAYPPGGSFVSPHSVRLEANEPATIYYTTDGTTPNTTSSAYDAPIVVDHTLALKFFATDIAGNAEAVKTANYAIFPGQDQPWAWGYNEYGQVGDGTQHDNLYIPVGVNGVTDVIAVAPGHLHTLALGKDGTVWAWGYNGFGQLGDGTTSDSPYPLQVNGLSGITALAGGAYHSLALKNDGTVWAWGLNGNGQLGDGTTNDSRTPVQVTGLTDVIAISGGYFHSLALRNDGTVWAWGQNGWGQLGNGYWDSAVPLQVGISGVTAIAGGGWHSLAITNDGAVWAWGYNDYGQLGDGTPYWSISPVSVIGVSGAVAIAGGAYHSLALKNDGTVSAWGYNGYGELGNGTYDMSRTAVPVSGLTGAVAIAGGAYHSLALKNDGTVWTWGYNNEGELGDGTSSNGPTPLQISGLSRIGAISAGGYHNIALKVHPLSVSTPSLPGGTVGVPYGQTLQASGGLAPYTWSIASGSLPTGLLLDGATGVVSGTPTGTGDFTFTVQIADAGAVTATGTYTVSIYSAPVIKPLTWWITPIGQPVNWRHTATGGLQPYTWALALGSLPSGLSLDGTTGRITGTPTELGFFTYVLQVTDAVGATDTEQFTFEVYDPLHIVTTSMSFGTRSTPYDQTLTAAGGKSPYQWSITAGALPGGVSLDSATGRIFGTPLSTGTFVFTATVRDSHYTSASMQLMIVIYDALVVSTGSFSTGIVGTSMNTAVTGTGGLQPYAWSVLTGTLPDGLALGAATGAISGMPTASGSFGFTVQITDANGSVATKPLSMTVYDQLLISTASLTYGISGTPYDQSLSGTGGLPPYTWSITSGSLPPGLALNSTTGQISGMPTATGTYCVSVQVADANASTATKQLCLTVHAPLNVTTGALLDGTLGSVYSQTLTATGGATPYTWSIDSGSLPAGLTLNNVTGELTGVPTAAGTFVFTIKVTDACSLASTKQLSLTVKCTVTATAGANGSITPSTLQMVNYNQIASFTITPNTGYHIATANGCGGTLNGSTYTTAPVTADCTVSATFAINTFTVTPTSGANGSISPSTPQTVNYSQTALFTVTPSTGYHIAAVSGCGGTLNGSTYNTGPVTADCTISVSFAVDRYDLSVSVSGTGSGTVTSLPAGIDCGSSCSATYDTGTSVTLTAAAAGDSLFAGWSGSCTGTGPCTVTMNASRSATATFSQFITVTTPNGGESWTRGSTYTIRWNYAGNPGSNVKIELLKGGVLNRTISSSTSRGSGGSGSYSWRVPSNQATGSDYTIRVTSTSNSNYKDTSNSNFAIN